MGTTVSREVNILYFPLSFREASKTIWETSGIFNNSENDFSKVLCLAPTPGKIKESWNSFHGLTKGAYLPPNIMTIKQFSKLIHSKYAGKKLISPRLVTPVIARLTGKSIGHAAIISNFIEEIKQYRPQTGIEELRNEFAEISIDLNVPDEVMKRALDAVEIFKQYQELLLKNNALDENDVMILCPSLIKFSSYKIKTLIMNGFYEVTPVEEQILKALIQQSDSTHAGIPFDKNYPSITSNLENFLKNNFNTKSVEYKTKNQKKNFQYHPYPDIDEEVEAVARHIKNLYVSGREKDLEKITLSFPEDSAYSEIVKRVFKRYGVPYSFAVSKTLGKTNPYLDVVALLESIADDYPRLQFSRFLASPHFKKLPEALKKWIPLISLSAGIIKEKTSWLSLRDIRSNNEQITDSPPEIEAGIKQVFQKLLKIESIKETGTFMDFSDALRKLLHELEFSVPDNDSAEQITDILNELSFIDTFNRIGSGAVNKSGLRNFIEGLKHMLNTTEAEPEISSGVQVIRLFDLRGVETEYLYLAGLKDGDLPSLPAIDHILPDNVRTRLGLVNMKRYLLVQKFIFHGLIESSKILHLSYPVMEGDKLYLPSPFLPRNAESIEKIPGIFSRTEELIQQGRQPLSKTINEIEYLKNTAIKNKFSKHAFLRVTDIDYYRMCPRKFFIEKVLSLEPIETREYEIEAMLLGTIAHKVMEKLIAGSYSDCNDMENKARDILHTLLHEYPLDNFWKNFIIESFLSILPDIYEIENKLRDEGYSFMKSEVSVEGEILKDIRLKGKIDRVDKKGADVELIDYKTGSAQLNRAEILNRGATLQLFLYAALMKSLGFNVNRVGIYSLKDIKITWIPGRNDHKEGRNINDYITVSMKYLEDTIQQMRVGNFKAAPMNDHVCRSCHERPYCPYIQTPV